MAAKRMAKTNGGAAKPMLSSNRFPMSRFDRVLPQQSRPDSGGIRFIIFLPNRRIMRTSSIMRHVLGRRPESKNFSAGANASTASPKDLIKYWGIRGLKRHPRQLK